MCFETKFSFPYICPTVHKHLFIMGKFIIRDKHIAFANAIVSGMPQYQAYIQHIAVNKKLKKETAHTGATKIMARSEMKQLVEKIKQERQDAINQEVARNIGKEFQTTILTTEEIDAFHCAVLQGLVEVEEVIIMRTLTYDEKGRVIKKTDTPMRVKRGPNIREKQVSAQELYRRRGDYKPMKFLGAFGKVNEEDGTLENVQRFVLLSNGERIPL